ncbi:MAG: Citryl-CoA lyase [Firmicutes bacterium]|nr:Citryl-CoA lyase [Bacillota bacterium]
MDVFRSCLAVPGNNPAMLLKSSSLGADVSMLDLEDGVAPTEKDAARLLLKHTLKTLDFSPSKVFVRINSLDTLGKEDLKAIVPCSPYAIIIPKVETAEQIAQVVEIVERYEPKDKPQIRFMPVIETARGLANVFSVADSSKRIVAISLGGEDFLASIGSKRSRERKELFFARSMMVTAAAAAGIIAIDTPVIDVDDQQGLVEDATFSAEMGFTGKICINPRQVGTVNRIFSPSATEIKWAKRIIKAMREHEENNSGVFSLDGKMVDLPIALQAEKIMYLVRNYGLDREGLS